MSTNLQINRLISYYTTVFSKEKEKDINESELIEIIRNLPLKSIIDLIRTAENKEAKEKLKLKLPAVTLSAKMRSGHKISEILEHTGLIQMDFDEIPDDEIEKFIELLKKDKYTFILFRSPSGRPKLIIKIPPELQNHKRYFEALYNYYKENYNLIADKSCKDPSRLCFLSHDPGIYVNQDAPDFTSIIQIKKPIPPSFEGKAKRDAIKIIKGIEEYGIDITKEYKNWMDIIFALIEIFGEDADEYIHRISRFYPSYEYRETQSQIEACRSSKGSGISKNSFFHIAKIYGIEITKNKVTISKNRNSKPNIFTVTEDYLLKHYDIRYNIITNEVEIKEKDSNEFTTVNENSLFIDLNKAGIGISKKNLEVLLGSDFVKTYDPFIDYFENLPDLDKEDYILKFCKYIKVKDQERFNYHFKKWLVRVVATAIEPKYFNKQILVFVSQQQDNGKSTLCRFFCPPSLNSYIAENISLDKDSRIMIARSIIINMDELSTNSNNSINTLKSIFSREQVNERLPYGKRNEVFPRRCSFVGNTNEFAFLKDETGSVRWLCFEVESIDWNYSKNIDINKVYSQAYSLYKSNKFKYDMTREDIIDNEKRNKEFFIQSVEIELILKYFEKGEKNPSNFYQPTEIILKLKEMGNIDFRLSNVKLGKALTALGYKRFKYNDRYGYYLELKS